MINAKINSLYETLVTNLAKLNWLPPLLARLSIGSLFAVTGWGKLQNLPKIVEFFTELHIPFPEIQAPFVAGTELVCGCLLIVGLATRLAAVPLTGTMVVAIITAKMKDVEGVTDFLALDEFVYIVIFIWLIVSGPGCMSVDGLFKKLTAKKTQSA